MACRTDGVGYVHDWHFVKLTVDEGHYKKGLFVCDCALYKEQLLSNEDNKGRD